MAIAIHTPLKLTWNTPSDLPAGTALDGTDGLEFTPSGPDQKMLIIFGGSGDVSILGGAGVLSGAATEDITITSGTQEVLAIESGRYMTADGKIKMSGDATVTVNVVFLP